MKNPVGWFEIYVQDMPRAKKFYEAVFEVSLQHLDAPMSGLEMWAFPMAENEYGAPGALVKMEGVPSGMSGSLVYFSCTDCANEQARVEKAGGRVKASKMPIGEYGFISLVYDTEDNLIGLHSMQ